MTLQRRKVAEVNSAPRGIIQEIKDNEIHAYSLQPLRAQQSLLKIMPLFFFLTLIKGDMK